MMVVGIIQNVSFFVALFSNSLFIFLCFSSRSKHFGKWQKLMICYSIYQMMYSVIEFVVLPIMYMKGPSMMMFSDGIFQNYHATTYVLIPIYCCTFATTLSLLSCQFLYRYFSICGGYRMEQLANHIFINSAVFSITCSFFWAAVVATFMQGNLEKKLHYGNDIMNIFGKEISEIVAYYILFKSRDANGKTYWNLDQLFAIGLLFSMMFFQLSIILTCGLLSYVQFQKNKYKYSRTTRYLHSQYFRVLTFQTAIPLITMYTPVGFFFIFPLFEFEVGGLINYTGAAVSLFPAVDPIISILVFKQFRRNLLSLLSCKSNRVDKFVISIKSISKI